MALRTHNGSKPRPEITWSIMHPVKPDPVYMREVIAQARNYHVDSFEICGEAHSSLGGLDGAIRFRDYPAACDAIALSAVERNVARLREIVALAHHSGRPVYYWHREVMVPRFVVQSIPGLLDENGEFNLLGDAYQTLMRSKIGEFFENVPDMDGLVLTLTESDYSVIHNSDPQRYPPLSVVERVVGTFAEELHRRGKRFVLRSFGSVAQDYKDILAGAQKVGDRFPFEIETKITPYDFSPFLPFNPYLQRSGACSLSAEYDSIGEFLGAGYLPAANPEGVIESVNYARLNGVNRHVIRVDRIGHAAFSSTQAINLLAFDRAILNPEVLADAIWSEWADAHWPECSEAMIGVMRSGIEVVKGTHFIDGHVIFHAFPIQPDFKWLKACGIFSVFVPNQPLNEHVGMWGLLTDRLTPLRENLLREKSESVALADEGLRKLVRLRSTLPTAEFRLASTAWRNASIVTRAIRDWSRCVCAYFDDMGAARPHHPALSEACAAGRAEFSSLLGVVLPTSDATGCEPAGGSANEYGGAENTEDGVEHAYVRPIWQLLTQLPTEYDAEFQERENWRARIGVLDYVVCGGLVDDLRVHRYMHASHALLRGGRPLRIAGNRVFPNGYLEVRLARSASGRCRLLVCGEAGLAGEFLLTIDGESRVARFSNRGEYECGLDRRSAPSRSTSSVLVRIQKVGAEYPAISSLGTLVGTNESQPKGNL